MKRATTCKPLLNHARTFLDVFGDGSVCVAPFRHGHLVWPAVRIALPERLQLVLVASAGYPVVPPLALATSEANANQLQLEWDLAESSERRLTKSLLGHIFPPGPVREVFGPGPKMLLTCDGQIADRAGWRRFYSGRPLDCESIQDGISSRSIGILSKILCDKSVFILGLGSGGSYVAEQLTRSGVGGLTLIDPDFVEAPNLSRTGYSVADVGELKAKALTRKLLNINPSLRIEAHGTELAELGSARLKSIIQDSQLLLALTDDPVAQSKLNHFAYSLDRPAIFRH